MLIKICGNTNQVNIEQVAMLKPSLMGFIVHPSSPRDVSKDINSLNLEKIPKEISNVLVTVDLQLDQLKKLVQQYGFDTVQLHGSESPSYCNKAKDFARVIKAFKVWDSLPVYQLKEYEGKVDHFLFDTDGKLAGGNGYKFKHSILEDYSLSTPYLLAGGIGSEDSEYIKSLNLPECIGVDINSRFETEPGIKDIDSLKRFLKKLNQ
ncbi:phosphoribosylanthranilate isomerase [Perlabentimonas gracilis]|uniref:phosphoribosylanthranilate isomerase n=1 Tax=Perlabentimonas gracilis TaxID=2715279 RepID=UPI00140D912C|nr:phosphoribosylanthranilate isomerase [Perlabentimonas gracilis]NHB68850.1 phosphoribosylanthranilate isomerase [Perlabentimonas gracilis]